MIIAKWKMKAIVQKTISFLPFSQNINLFFQKYVTKGLQLSEDHFRFKLIHASDHIRFFKQFGQPKIDGKILELGTGWYPIIPISMFLCNVGQVLSMDIRSWLTADNMLITISKFMEWHDAGKLMAILPDVDLDKLDLLKEIIQNKDQYDLQNMKAIIGLETLVIDARSTDIDDNSIDFVCSNNTFEHVYATVLEDILIEFKRVCKKGGVMSHFIDMSDHFAHFDKSINIYNFLQYSQSKWNKIDNNIQPQNRLRFKDFKGMYARLSIPVSTEETRAGSLEELRSIDLSPMYEKYSETELAISHGYIVSVM